MTGNRGPHVVGTPVKYLQPMKNEQSIHPLWRDPALTR